MLKLIICCVFMVGGLHSFPQEKFDLPLAPLKPVTDKCVLPFKPEYSFFSPLIFSTSGHLLSSENVSEELEDLTLNGGEVIVLSCQPNYFRKMPKDKVLRGKCVNGRILSINGENKNFTKDLSCEVRSIEEIITKVPGCPSSMRSIEYGYTNPLTRFSYVIGESCYSTEKGKTIFVHTKLRESKTDSSEISLKKIEHENYFRGVHPSSFWKIDFMKAARVDEMEKTLKSLLGTEKVPVLGIKKFIGDEFLTHKQFQAVLRLTWNNFISYDEEVLENFDLLQQDILGLGVKNVEIYTGGHGVLSWKNDEGKSVEIYLREGKYPVPNFIWTVVKSDDKATAFAVSNNPMLTADEIEANTFCKSKCDKITWITNLLNEEKYKNGKNGFVLCCALNDFRSTVTEMPELVDVVGMFK